MAVLTVEGLKVRYSAKGPEILKGIDFEVKDDDFLAIIGPSGAGKSTLIRCVNRLVEPSSGKIMLLGEDVCSLRPRALRNLRRNVGMIFQEFNLINRMSVMDNVLSGRLGYTGNMRSLFRAFPQDDIQLALYYLDRVGLSEHVNKRADQLSGGQRQRVGIARALASDPKILLCDEATSALDPQTTKSILELLQDINKRLGITIVVITHEMAVVKEICHRVAVIESGVIKEMGRVVDIFTNPQSQTMKDFVTSIINMELPAGIKNLGVTDQPSPDRVTVMPSAHNTRSLSASSMSVPSRRLTAAGSNGTALRCGRCGADSATSIGPGSPPQMSMSKRVARSIARTWPLMSTARSKRIEASVVRP